MCVCMRVRETATCTAFANLHRRHLQPCVSQLGCLRPQPYGLRSDQINFMLSMRGCIWIPCGNARCEDVSSHASALQALPQPLQVTLVLDTPRLPAAASVAACWFVDLRLAAGQHSAQGGGGVSGCARGSWRGEGSRAEAQTVLWRQSASQRSCRCVLTDPPGVTRFTLRPLHPPATLHLRPCPRRLAWTALQAKHAAGHEACHFLKSGSRPDAPRPPGSRRTCKRIRRPPAAPGPPATTSSTGRSGLDGASARRDSSLNQGVLRSLLDQSRLVERKVCAALPVGVLAQQVLLSFGYDCRKATSALCVPSRRAVLWSCFTLRCSSAGH